MQTIVLPQVQRSGKWKKDRGERPCCITECTLHWLHWLHTFTSHYTAHCTGCTGLLAIFAQYTTILAHCMHTVASLHTVTSPYNALAAPCKIHCSANELHLLHRVYGLAFKYGGCKIHCKNTLQRVHWLYLKHWVQNTLDNSLQRLPPAVGCKIH